MSVSKHHAGLFLSLQFAVLTSVFVCGCSIIETKGTRGCCGGASPRLCSAFCLTGGSLLEEVERGGGERAFPSCLFESSLPPTGLLMALSHLAWVCCWGAKGHRGTGTTNFYTSRVFFFVFFSSGEDAMIARDSSTVQRRFFGMCVASSFCTVHRSRYAFALHNVSMSMTSTDPENALFSVLCRNEYRQNWAGSETNGNSRVDLLISTEAVSQNKAFCTSTQWNFDLLVFFLYCFSSFHSFSLVWNLVNITQLFFLK